MFPLSDGSVSLRADSPRNVRRITVDMDISCLLRKKVPLEARGINLHTFWTTTSSGVRLLLPHAQARASVLTSNTLTRTENRGKTSWHRCVTMGDGLDEFPPFLTSKEVGVPASSPGKRVCEVVFIPERPATPRRSVEINGNCPTVVVAAYAYPPVPAYSKQHLRFSL